ncbi:MAG TPA: small, acid-soluble spore protein, alpha/beta type [Symbiobacteriaceae bacterium]
MAQFTPTGKVLPHDILDRFKWEIAAQEGLVDKITQAGWPEMTSRECGRIGGRIGGRMVKVLIRHAQQALHDGSAPQ